MKNISVKYKLIYVLPLFALIPSCVSYDKVVVNKKTTGSDDASLKVTQGYGDESLDVQHKSDTLVIWTKGTYYLYGRFNGR